MAEPFLKHRARAGCKAFAAVSSRCCGPHQPLTSSLHPPLARILFVPEQQTPVQENKNGYP